MQAEKYNYKRQMTSLLWLAQKLSLPKTSEEEASDIIAVVKQTNPNRAKQLAEFREKFRRN